MNDRFIKDSHIILQYEVKAGTKGSFYQCGGRINFLPNRISLGMFAQRKISNKDHLKKNEINATYKKNEEGFYSGFPSKKIHTSIWKFENYPEFYGYGILDERYVLRDLLIFYSSNNCETNFEIHIFQKMGKQEYLIPCFQFLRNYINKKPLLQ
jgi:hypothetical protein